MNGAARISRLEVRHLTVIALVAVVMLIAKTSLRMHIGVSGHGGVLWIAALLVGTAVVRRPGASLMMGLLGGTLVALFLPGDAMAPLTVLKYVLPGLLLELLAPMLGYRFDQWLPAILAGAAAHAAKVATDILQGVIAGLPQSVILAGLTVELLLHIGFGALGGFVAVLLMRALLRARIPQLADIAERGEER
jgi:ABC-type thiamin/hydroxymethylpyrimidine transport system permease subunit